MRRHSILKDLIIVILISLLGFYLSFAKSAEVQASRQQPGGILFKVQDGHHVLYLLGSIHVGAADFYPLAPVILRTLEQAPALALEIDPEQLPALQAAVLQNGIYAAGESFRSALSEPVQRQLLAALEKNHISEDSIAHMRPWMIASLLTMQQAEGGGYSAALGVDNYLAQLAHARHQAVIELEGAARQLALFGALAPAQQSLLLEDTLQELDNAGSAAQLSAITACWREGDLPRLQGLLDDMRSAPGFVDRFTKTVMIDQRNPFLADRLATLLAQQDGVFAAIGMLHLVGANGVPALLAQRGLQVERVDLSP